MFTQRWRAGKIRRNLQKLSPSFQTVKMSLQKRERSPVYTSRFIVHGTYALSHALGSHPVTDPTIGSPTESRTLTPLLVESIALQAASRRVTFVSFQKPFSLEENSLFIIPFVDWVVGRRKLHQNTFRRCWSRIALNSTTSLFSSHIVWPIMIHVLKNKPQSLLQRWPRECRGRCVITHWIQPAQSPFAISYRRSKRDWIVMECQKEPSWGYTLSYFPAP